MDHRRRLLQIRKNIQLELEMLNITDTTTTLNDYRANKRSQEKCLTTRDYSNERKFSFNSTRFTHSPSPSSSSSSKSSRSATTTNKLQTYEMKRKNSAKNPVGRYTNWNSTHTQLASQAWCCLGDLLSFCNKYECKIVRTTDARSHSIIVSEVRSLLSGEAPFNITRRFPNNVRNRDLLWICIGRSPTIEYQLGRIQSIFRRPLSTLTADKQRMARENFHLAIKEMLRDIPSAVTDVKAYDRDTFERDFRLQWSNDE